MMIAAVGRGHAAAAGDAVAGLEVSSVLKAGLRAGVDYGMRDRKAQAVLIG